MEKVIDPTIKKIAERMEAATSLVRLVIGMSDLFRLANAVKGNAEAELVVRVMLAQAYNIQKDSEVQDLFDLITKGAKKVTLPCTSVGHHPAWRGSGATCQECGEKL